MSVLTKPTVTADRSAPDTRLEVQQQDLDMDKHQNYYLDLGMSQWLEYVEDLSFPTMSVPLTVDDARDLRACYAHLHDGMKSASLPPNLLASMTALGQRLAPPLAAMACPDGFAFAKLSGRSAKDSPLHTARLDASVRDKLHADMDDSLRLVSLFDSALELMRVGDVAQLLWLLINSQRVDEDLDVALKYPERWDQAVVVRTWWSGVSNDLEFRMFVVDGEPTGLTQYNQFLFSQRVAARGDAIAQALVAYYEQRVLPRLTGTDFFRLVEGRYTCDLALHPDALPLVDELVAEGGNAASALSTLLDGSSQLIRVVELNCFYEATGMGLFDYARDAEALSRGPCEHRVRTEPLPHADVKLEEQWRAVLATHGDRRAHLTDEAWAQLKAALQQ